MDEDSQEALGTKLFFRMLVEGQKDMHAKIDALHKFMEEHMAKEEKDLLQTRVHLASLDEKVSSQSRKWGIVSTIVTSVISAIGVNYFVRHGR